MANLPLKLLLPQMQTQWSAILNPVIANPITSGLQLSAVELKTGTNVINHTLQRQMRGWFVTDIDAVATIYRPATSYFNKTTLTLVASAPATVALWVY
jgi:hypothetical protein